MTILGIDVGKEFIDCELLNEKRTAKKFANSVRGFEQIAAWLSNRKVSTVHACMEATGGYGDELAYFFHEQGHTVSIVNPIQIRAFGQSELSRTKTDKADAALIARFCSAMNPPAWEPPKPAERRLKQLVRRRAALVEMQTQEQNRLQSPGNENIRESILQMIKALDKQIRELNVQIKKTIDDDDDLKRQRDLIQSVKGLGPITAAVILAETPHIENFKTQKALTSYSGLCPQIRQSGSSVKSSRTTPIGNRNIRAALFMPAMTAALHNPVIKAFAARLRERGKRPMEIRVAVMRKLMVLVFGVLKTQKPFDPLWA